jgi:hypothetical protein
MLVVKRAQTPTQRSRKTRKKGIQAQTTGRHTLYTRSTRSSTQNLRQNHTVLQTTPLADWLEKAMDPDLWTVHKYILAPAGDGGKTRIPNLTDTGTRWRPHTQLNQDKGKALAKVFFPKKPQQAADPISNEAEHPPPACTMDPITKEQIKKAHHTPETL